MRILPDMVQRMVLPFSNSTLNIALGSGSTTVPSSSIASCLLTLLYLSLQLTEQFNTLLKNQLVVHSASKRHKVNKSNTCHRWHGSEYNFSRVSKGPCIRPEHALICMCSGFLYSQTKALGVRAGAYPEGFSFPSIDYSIRRLGRSTMHPRHLGSK